jgi:hypothetical protein
MLPLARTVDELNQKKHLVAKYDKALNPPPADADDKKKKKKEKEERVVDCLDQYQAARQSTGGG